MGLRFQKRIKIFPGVYINLSKSGVSASVGGKGATVNVGADGRRMRPMRQDSVGGRLVRQGLLRLVLRWPGQDALGAAAGRWPANLSAPSCAPARAPAARPATASRSSSRRRAAA